MTKKDLAVELSKLLVFDDADQNLEQYSTDSEVAADMIWNASMLDWIKDKTIADLGAGTGILGLGCLLMGAKDVFFVEKDASSIDILKKNISSLKEEFDITSNIKIINEDISSFNENCDLVIQNPPFGTQEKGTDTVFLEKATTLSNRVITMHKSVTKNHVKEVFQARNYAEKRYFEYNYPLKMTLSHHKKKIKYIRVSAWFLEKKD